MCTQILYRASQKYFQKRTTYPLPSLKWKNYQSHQNYTTLSLLLVLSLFAQVKIHISEHQAAMLLLLPLNCYCYCHYFCRWGFTYLRIIAGMLFFFTVIEMVIVIVIIWANVWGFTSLSIKRRCEVAISWRIELQTASRDQQRTSPVIHSYFVIVGFIVIVIIVVVAAAIVIIFI